MLQTWKFWELAFNFILAGAVLAQGITFIRRVINARDDTTKREWKISIVVSYSLLAALWVIGAFIRR